jgi:hypothetical protein
MPDQSPADLRGPHACIPEPDYLHQPAGLRSAHGPVPAVATPSRRLPVCYTSAWAEVRFLPWPRSAYWRWRCALGCASRAATIMMGQPGVISTTLIGAGLATAQTNSRLSWLSLAPGVPINLTVGKLHASPALHVLGQQCGEVRVRATR